MRLALVALLIAGCGASTHEVAAPIAAAEPDAGPVDPDRDRDGIAEVDDLCPCDAEDVDGWQDADGCPDPDNDGDRIVDACDLCPNDVETYNGNCDEDGCPDRGSICLEDSRIVILETIRFRRAEATILAPSIPIVDAIAAILSANPEITLVALVGEAEPREPRRQGLARARAEAVLEALVARGVDRARLVAEADPAPTHAPEDPPDAWRRVRLDIRTIRGLPADQADPTGCGASPPCEVPVCTPPAVVPPAGCQAGVL